MTIKIAKRITGYTVSSRNDAAPRATDAAAAATASSAPPKADVIQMHERLERPETLEGSTYKIRSPLIEHALYVTINDIVLNAGTRHESRRPFEIFINSKNMEHFQWIVALTRIVSAVFRKGGDVTFLAEELKAVFDPRGGYFQSTGTYMPSVVAEIGSVIEQHLKKIGMIVDEGLSEAQRALIADKRREHQARLSTTEQNSYPAGAGVCPKCHAAALVVLDGCETCLACGHSKCG